MSSNQIESAKENVGFLTRTMLAYLAGVYLLIGAAGHDMVAWFNQGTNDPEPIKAVTVVAFVCAAVLSAEVIRLQRKIKKIIKQIGGTL